MVLKELQLMLNVFISPNQRSILTTPLEIYRAAKKLFPDTVVKIVQFRPELHISLQFNKKSDPLNITKAVNRCDLELELALAVLYNKVSEPIVMPALTQTEVPLEGSVEFERQMCSSCLEAIRKFLADPESEEHQKIMTALGLDPEHVMPLDQSNSGETIRFFIEALSPCSHGDVLLANFQRRYPEPFQQRLGMEKKKQEIVRTRAMDPCANMTRSLERQIVGQPDAIKTLAPLLATGEGNVKALFVGPTGVGKTEFAKVVASYRQVKLTEFHMHQFRDEHQVSTLFGAAAGVLSSDSKPQLALQLDQAENKIEAGDTITIKNHVLLFDEIEKAHPKVRASLLTLLDEGKFTVSFTERGITGGVNKRITYVLQGCAIFCTSNACQETLVRAARSGRRSEELVAIFKAANAIEPLETRYSEEFLGRLTIVPFKPISPEDHKTLLRHKIDSFCATFAAQIGCDSIQFRWTSGEYLLTALHAKFYGTGVDLRHIKRDLIEKLEGFIQARKADWGELSDVALHIDKASTEDPIKLIACLRNKFSGRREPLDSYIVDCWG
jgi:hypothetical protein